MNHNLNGGISVAVPFIKNLTTKQVFGLFSQSKASGADLSTCCSFFRDCLWIRTVKRLRSAYRLSASSSGKSGDGALGCDRS
ncbi:MULTISPECIES: hypothetical protein [unclassified Microcoleus]|uniref:hypothetical protein n=1 Tax=unclassified Microcoleus TaxID=2642155 RepID=UPI002FD094AE